MSNFRFHRRVKIFPGLTVNLSKSGPSVTFGVRGAHVTVDQLSGDWPFPSGREFFRRSGNLRREEITMAENLDEYWARIGAGIDAYLAANRNSAVEGCLLHLVAFMAYTTEDIHGRATANRNLLGTVDALPILAFDALRSALESQRVLSLAGTALAARTCFEAACTMKFVAGAGADAATYAQRYARWMHVETLQHYAKTGEQLSQLEFDRHVREAAEWLDPGTTKVKRYAHWANDPRFSNLFEIAKRVGQEDVYRNLYGGGSAFVHASSTTTRLYRVGGQLRQISDVKHVSRFGWTAGHSALELQQAFLEFFGVPYEKGDVAGLLSRFVDASKTIAGENDGTPPESAA